MSRKITLAIFLVALSSAATAGSGPATQIGPGAQDQTTAGGSPKEVTADYLAYRAFLAGQSPDADQAQLEALDRASALIDGISDWNELRGGRAKQFVKAHGKLLKGAAGYEPAEAWATCELATSAGSRVESVSCIRESDGSPGTSDQMRRLNQGSQQTG